MSPPEILAEALRRGIVLAPDGDRLRYRVPPGARVDDLLADLAANEREILAAIGAEGLAPPTSVPAEYPAEPEMLPPADVADWRPPTWEQLSILRWGPAVGDPTPGIIVDVPCDGGSIAEVRAAGPTPDRGTTPDVADGPATIDPAVSPIGETGQAEWLNAQAAWAAGQDEAWQFALEARVEADFGGLIPIPAGPQPWRCTAPLCRDGSRWWISIYGVIYCANCRPPSFLDSVANTGSAADAPLVEVDRSTTPIAGTIGGRAMP